MRGFNEQQVRIKQLTADVRTAKEQSLRTERATTNDYIRGRAKKVAAKAKARETRWHKMMSTEERIEKPRMPQLMRLELPGRKLNDSLIVSLRGVALRRGANLLLSNVNVEFFGSQRVALIGQNGSGKSSFLQMIMDALPPADGEMWKSPGLRVGYLSQNQIEFAPDESVLDYFQNKLPAFDSSTARTLLSRFQFTGEQVFQPVNRLSRGEQTKLMLATFMAAEFDLLILDEPTNHLDVSTMECL